nr:MAG: thiamine pyrophosphate-binding protein [Hyphomicrobiales bacterium]
MDRRNFIKGAAVAGAAAIGAGESAKAAILPQGAAATQPAPSEMRPSTYAQAEGEFATPNAASMPQYPGVKYGKPGSDFMVDVLKTLDIDYIITNPASSCRGIHESLVNYGGNSKPELLTAMHEETCTAVAHGYFKVAGKPMGALCHGTVGLQHAAMAVYNAWCDRVPVLMLSGNELDANVRRPGVPTTHAAQDPGAFIRDFTKWDDQPASLQHFAESMVRAYRIAMTPPYEPVHIVMGEALQEDVHSDVHSIRIPQVAIPTPPQGNSNAVQETAALLVAAENPVLVVDRAARTQAGLVMLIELAELLQSPVVDQGGRMNFPNMHHLYARGAAQIRRADVIVGMELTDMWGTVNDFLDTAHATQGPITREGVKMVSIGVGDVYIRANYQDFQRYRPVDIAMAADAEATLPSLIEAVRSQLDAPARARIERRGQALRDAYATARERVRADAAANAWNASTISGARLSAELWGLIKNEDWALVSRDQSISNWPHRIWNFDKYYQWIGGPGGSGIGYGLPAAVGAALAHREHGRLVVNIQNDGDCMYAPGALWTATHHSIPLLNVMHNNRAYHQEVMHLQRLSSWRQRGLDESSWRVATTIENPFVDYGKLAQSMGMEGIGPIDNPNDLRPALQRAIEVVKGGAPALVDVVTQPR